MVEVCAGYLNGDMLFDVAGLEGEARPVPSFVANTFSVLTRGAPTRPSPQLLSLLMPLEENPLGEWEKLAAEPLCLIDENRPIWHNTIRGDNDTGYNPAAEFFFEVLPEKLPEISFIQNLLVPEYPLFRKLGAPRSLMAGPNDEAVDFYLPQANLVIEIDGEQHAHETQKGKDIRRDQFLEKYGIHTFRLRTVDLQAHDVRFSDFCTRLSTFCLDHQHLQAYKKFLTEQSFERSSLRLDISAAVRLQIAVILGISHGQIDPRAGKWQLNVKQDFVSSKEINWAKSALEELLDWFSLFARLTSSKFEQPEIVLSSEGVRFDIRMFERPDDRNLPLNAICVRTCAMQKLPFVVDNRSPRQIVQVQELGVSNLAISEVPDFSKNQPNLNDLNELSHRIFGHESFRPGQDTLILNALLGQKSLGLMPTGGGKSLCFELPSLLLPGTTITIVPIKALGRDHCAELAAAGFTGRVVNIDSDMPATLRESVIFKKVQSGAMRFVFVSPERFQNDKFRNLVAALKERNLLRMFVVDEVHCLSEWGHDFRPSYLTLPGTLRNLADDVPVLGLTATASVNVLRDIQSEFEIPDELVAYEMHRSRTELNFRIQKSLSSPEQIAKNVNDLVAVTEGNTPPPIHIFARYADGVLGVEAYATMLANSSLGLRIGSFSGRMPKNFDLESSYERLQAPEVRKPLNYEEYKQTVQELWKAGKLDVIVTTKAFGMGVNKPDVRHTLHAGMPSSMEAFYQEAGRAGRDRSEAYCHMLLRTERDEATQIFESLRKGISPTSIQKALDFDTEDNRLPRNGRGDFRAQLWFLRQGLVSEEDEAALVMRLYEIVKGATDPSIFISIHEFADLRYGAERLQTTLYRLYQLGYIGPWTVTDWGHAYIQNSNVQSVIVEKLPITFTDACRNFISRVQAIDGKSANLSSVDKLLAHAEKREDWFALIKLLITWVRRKHLDSRLQSTWNLYRKCIDFTPENATAFRDELESYFKIDNKAFQLASLRDMPFEEVVTRLEHLLFHVPEEGMDRSLRRLSAQLARLLEGTQESRGLNLTAAMLLLMTNEKAGLEAKMRFEAAVPNGALEFLSGPGRSILIQAASYSQAARDTIGSWLVEESASRQTLLEIYENIPAEAVEIALLEEFASELTNVV